MTRLFLLCGSQRVASLNARLLDEISGFVPADYVQDRLVCGDVGLPLFHQDREHDPAILSEVAMLHRRIATADALVVASPEYNGLMTPFLKNLVDWVSRLPHLNHDFINAFLDKPVLLTSATPGWSGGGLGILALRTLFGHIGAVPFGETICLPYADQVWDGPGLLAVSYAGWQECVERFCAFVAGRCKQATGSGEIA